MDKPPAPLYNVWNVEGEPNLEETAILHEMQEKLKNEPEFVGIVPFGSTMKGYNTPSSDIDITILYRFDGKLHRPVGAADSVLTSLKNGQFDFIEKADAARESVQAVYGRRVNLLTQIIDPLVYTDENDNVKPNLQAFLYFPQHITGNKSVELFTQAQTIFKNLPFAEQVNMVNDLTELLVHLDTLSIEKMKKRDYFKNDSEAYEWLVERKALWHERVIECFTPEEVR
jgi:predicted nucleotidyltransferase